MSMDTDHRWVQRHGWGLQAGAGVQPRRGRCLGRCMAVAVEAVCREMATLQWLKWQAVPAPCREGNKHALSWQASMVKG